jgi:xanthine dehydrogenase molybdopterin-binding subunit B
VLTRDDLKGINPYWPVDQDQAILAMTRCYEGDPVAAVAAETVEIAEAAIKLMHGNMKRWSPLSLDNLATDAPDHNYTRRRFRLSERRRGSKETSQRQFSFC